MSSDETSGNLKVCAVCGEVVADDALSCSQGHGVFNPRAPHTESPADPIMPADSAPLPPSPYQRDVFRSPLLKPLHTRPRLSRRAHLRRLGLIFGGLALLGLAIGLTLAQVFPKRGLGYLFYWLHDALYLPLKGYTFTLFFPLSLSWWLWIGLALLISLMAVIFASRFWKPYTSFLLD